MFTVCLYMSAAVNWMQELYGIGEVDEEQQISVFWGGAVLQSELKHSYNSLLYPSKFISVLDSKWMPPIQYNHLPLPLSDIGDS